MACYSYNSNAIINYNNNIEIVYTASGTTYSFGSIAWICEFPVDEQLAVYTRPTPTGTETLKIYNTDYTINTTTSNIVFTSAPSGQVVIRRSTPSQRMLFKFIDGAKLTANQLNASLHQLLFMVQEKEFAGSTFNHFYSLTSSVPAWTTATSYTPGQVVSNAGSFYLCTTAHTSTTAPPNSNWTLINPASSGFLIQGGPNPVVFNLSSLTTGSSLVWNGSQFTASTFTSTLDSLSDVDATSPNNKAILSYNSGTSRWVLKNPSIDDLAATNLIFQDRTFYSSSANTSYTNNGTSIDVSSKLSLLGKFKNADGSKWVLTDPPTVYHIVKQLVPSSNGSGSQDPETYLNYINSAIQGLSANITNPVKVKLEWDLSLERRDLVNYTDGKYLSDMPTAFWDSPYELYNPLGYNLSATPPIKWHGVQVTNATGNIHRSSPFFYQELTSASALVRFVSKLRSYGVKAFYLSIPESHTSCLADIPAMESGNSNIYFTSPGTVALNTLTGQLNAIGNETVGTYRDYYLMGLRDMAFAGSRPLPADVTTAKNRDGVSRNRKSLMIAAVYNGLENISFFKRLEDSSDTGASCLWKIPKQIIYYNKAALSNAIKDSATLMTSSSFPTNTVRFTGYSELLGVNANTNSTILSDGTGKYFKADEFWNGWCQRWTTDLSPLDNSTMHFNEADIDWMAKGVNTSTEDIELFRVNEKTPPKVYRFDSNERSRFHYPWWYRPNEIMYGDVAAYQNYNLIGTHLFNLDVNKLFSESHNFIPDPVDEYVFRIVTKKSLLGYFANYTVGDPYTSLKSSIILEYGFSDHNFNHLKTKLTNKYDIFKHGLLRPGVDRVMSFLNKNNVKVYVKNETVETVGSDDRYVITLGIRVPRLKSIGYSKIFRKWSTSGVWASGDYPKFDTNNSADSEIDGGPWSFNDLLLNNGADVFSTANWQANSVSNLGATILYDGDYPLTNIATSGTSNTRFVNESIISGRNECAVKFTRIGIPSNLWIRLSVLNTDGSLELLDGTSTNNGFNVAAIAE